MWLYLEYIKNASLKKAFFILTFLWLSIGCILGTIVFFMLEQLNDTRNISLKVGSDTLIYEIENANVENENLTNVVRVLQVIIPVICIILSVIIADVIFFRIKIYKPVKVLYDGACKIINNNLDFAIKSESADELGQLCMAFEKMRNVMENTIKMLWKEADERRRLNAAFSHDLRNPVTILKGEVTVLKRGIFLKKLDDTSILNELSGLEKNIQRIEDYIDVMSTTRRLEESTCIPKQIKSENFLTDIKHHVNLLIGDSHIQLTYDTSKYRSTNMYLDLNIFYNILDNIILNSLRYAKKIIDVGIEIDGDYMKIFIQDDGPGFSKHILKHGMTPFVRDGKNYEGHFGMGLYICRLFCEKHRGTLEIENNRKGALNKITIKIT